MSGGRRATTKACESIAYPGSGTAVVDFMIERKELIKRLLLKPVDVFTVLPFVLGVTTGLAAWAFDFRSGIWWFSSLVLILLAALFYVQRLALKWGSYSDRIIADWQAAETLIREQRLDELHVKLKKDNDKRTDDLLDDLRVVTGALAREVGQSSGWVRSLSQETMSVVDQLFGACIHYLDKTYELYTTAMSVKDKTIRKRHMDEREKLIEEVQKSLHQLGEILVNVRAINLKRATNSPVADPELAGLERLRKELSMKLHAAKEIEEAVAPKEGFQTPEMKKYIDKAKESQKQEGG